MDSTMRKQLKREALGEYPFECREIMPDIPLRGNFGSSIFSFENPFKIPPNPPSPPRGRDLGRGGRVENKLESPLASIYTNILK